MSLPTRIAFRSGELNRTLNEGIGSFGQADYVEGIHAEGESVRGLAVSNDRSVAVGPMEVFILPRHCVAGLVLTGHNHSMN